MSFTVLIVDDDAGFRRLTRGLFSDSGVEVIEEAGTAEAAREALSRLRPDAVLVDVSLPDGNGIALAREFAALEWSPRVVLTSTDAGIAPDRIGNGIVFVAKEDLPTAPLRGLVSAASG
jgi:DNA-binding NarL/FixJ family response regulator